MNEINENDEVSFGMRIFREILVAASMVIFTIYFVPYLVDYMTQPIFDYHLSDIEGYDYSVGDMVWIDEVEEPITIISNNWTTSVPEQHYDYKGIYYTESEQAEEGNRVIKNEIYFNNDDVIRSYEYDDIKVQPEEFENALLEERDKANG